MRVIVQGRLKQRSYEDREGVKRTVYELDVEEVGASLRSATAKVTKASGRGGQGGQGGYGGGSGGQAGGGWGGNSGGGQPSGGAPADDPWATGAPAGGSQGASGGGGGGGGGWGGNSGGSGSGSGSGGGYSDEPPSRPSGPGFRACSGRGWVVPNFLITQEKHHGEAACAQA